jgi:hypothetical protein
MVGGKVIGASLRNGKYLLNVQDTGKGYSGTCAVRCEAKRMDNGQPVAVMIGDSVWWQSGKVYWSPGNSCQDIPLKKIGDSH